MQYHRRLFPEDGRCLRRLVRRARHLGCREGFTNNITNNKVTTVRVRDTVRVRVEDTKVKATEGEEEGIAAAGGNCQIDRDSNTCRRVNPVDYLLEE